MTTTLGTDSPKTSIVDFTQTCCMDISLLSCFFDGKGRGRGADLLCFVSTLTLPSAGARHKIERMLQEVSLKWTLKACPPHPHSLRVGDCHPWLIHLVSPSLPPYCRHCLHERASDTDPRSHIRCPAGACDLLRRNLQCREPIIIPRQSAPEVVSQHVFRDDVKPKSEQVQHAWMQLINRVIDVAAIPEAHTNLHLCVKHLGHVSACQKKDHQYTSARHKPHLPSIVSSHWAGNRRQR